MNRKISMLCISLLVMSSSMVGFADTTETENTDSSNRPVIEGKKGPEKPLRERGEGELKEDSGEKLRPLKENASEETKQKKEKMNKQRENRIQEKDLEKQLKKMEEGAGNDELRRELNEKLKGLKDESKQLRKELKQKIKEGYSEEELESIKELKAQLENEYKDMKVLGVDNILSDSADFKFDAPPVIKEGRTLIPVRAISEGFDAEVSWDGDEKKVTITKDGIVIELWLGNSKATVSGADVELDSNPEIIRGRTFVPLRFIAETLKLDVKWNSEDDTIELITDDEEAAVEEEAEEEAEEEEATEEEAAEEEEEAEEEAEEEEATEEETAVDEDVVEDTQTTEEAEEADEEATEGTTEETETE